MPLDFRELEETLTRLESVDAARVVNQGNTITEIHVIAASDKPSKQVARDVQSLAMARFGYPLDHRVISVVQISPSAMDYGVAGRAALRGVTESPNGNRTTIEVTLHHDNEERVGTVTGPAVASARLRLIGQATIDAIEQTFKGTPPMALDAIARNRVGTREVMVAVVAAAGLRGSEEFSVGSAIVSEDADEAAVKAVLNALNRKLASLGE